MKFLKIKDEGYIKVAGEPAGREIVFINIDHIVSIRQTQNGKKRELNLTNDSKIITCLTVENLIQQITSETK